MQQPEAAGRPIDGEPFDAVIVGARCAGAATAMLLARAGARVIVLDRDEPGTDTLSTHGIARTGMVQLQRWELLDDLAGAGARAFSDVEFHGPDGPVVRRTMKPKSGIDHMIAPRRPTLDGTLQRAAATAGADLRFGTTVRDVLTDDTGRVTGVSTSADGGTIHARYVIGADGIRSRVARRVGAEMIDVREPGAAVHYRYVTGPWDAFEYHAADGSFAGVFPTDAGEGCVWVFTPPEVAHRHRSASATVDAAFDRMLRDAAPALFERFAAASDTGDPSPARGMVQVPNHIRQPWGPGWALVGDSAVHRDPITGHGISDAFRDAELVAAALLESLDNPTVEAATFGHYADERDRLQRRLFELTVRIAELPDYVELSDLQRELGAAIDEQAAELAAWGSCPTLRRS